MTRMHRPLRTITASGLTLGLLVVATAPAVASSASEQRQGAQVLSEVRAGKLRGTDLTSTQYEHVGQYLMGRALGSTQGYETMDALMDRVMGQSISDQMYLYMGERYLGNSVSPNSGYAPYYGWMADMMSRHGGSWAGMMGGYMMGAYRSTSGQGSAPYGGMMDGYLPDRGAQSGATPGASSSYPLGPSMMNHAYGTGVASGSSGWPTAAIVAVALLGALLLMGALAFLRPRLPRARAGSGAPAARNG